jgi:hypothetical protein
MWGSVSRYLGKECTHTTSLLDCVSPRSDDSGPSSLPQVSSSHDNVIGNVSRHQSSSWKYTSDNVQFLKVDTVSTKQSRSIVTTSYAGEASPAYWAMAPESSSLVTSPTELADDTCQSAWLVAHTPSWEQQPSFQSRIDPVKRWFGDK